MYSTRSKKHQRGFLTLEVLLAMAVMVFSFSAAIVLSFSGQELTADSQTSFEAMVLAREMIESQRDSAKKDFRLVNPTSTIAGIYEKKIEVGNPFFFSKNVKAGVSWNIDGRPQKVELLAMITDYNATAGNDTCDSNLSGDWVHPQIKEFKFSELTGVASSTISDIDAYKGKLYVTVGDTASTTDPTFFVFDISDPNDLKLIDKIDNSGNKSGLNAVAASDDYAFVANISTVNQLQIINIKNNPITIVGGYSVQDDDGARGNSIFYKNGYVYLGMEGKPNGAEFRILNVKLLSNISEAGRWPKSGGLKHDINDIYVKGGNAYLAHPTDADESGGCPQEQLTVLDISDTANPHRINGFYHSGGILGNGKSLYLIGDRIYFGRVMSHISGSADAIPEFYVLDNKNPASTTIDLSGSVYLTEIESVTGVVVRSNLAFLLTSRFLRIFDVGAPNSIAQYAAPSSFSGKGVALDCEKNYLYAASIDDQGRSYLSVITAK